MSQKFMFAKIYGLKVGNYLGPAGKGCISRTVLISDKKLVFLIRKFYRPNIFFPWIICFNCSNQQS